MALVTAAGVFFTGCHMSQNPGPDLQLRNGPQTTSPAISSATDQARVEAHAHYATGVIHAFGAENGPALDEFYAAALKDPENEALALEVSGDFLQLGQPDRALAVLERAARAPHASGEVEALLGAVRLQLNRLELAATASRAALKKNPQSLTAYQTLFQIEVIGKRGTNALALLDGAGRVPAATPEFLTGLGELCLGLGRQLPEQKAAAHLRALRFFHSASRLPGQGPEVQLRLAEGFAALEQGDQAVAGYLELLKKFPDLPLLHQTIQAKLPSLFLRTTNRLQTAELLQNMLGGNPTDARVVYFLGNLATEQTNFVQAADYFSRTVLLNPDFEPAYGELANAQLALNHLVDAQATLADARKKFPRSFVLEYLSGLVASRQKNYTNALGHFTAAEIIAQAASPQRLTEYFYFQLGSASERLGDLAQAEKYFLKCLELAPDFDDAQNYLGFMWAEHGQNLDRARELIGKALKTDPQNPAYLDSMAWVLFKLNQPGPALEFALQAQTNSEEADAEIYHHLGDIYAALGRMEQAREAWRKSFEVEPDERVRKKLEPDPK